MICLQQVIIEDYENLTATIVYVFDRDLWSRVSSLYGGIFSPSPSLLWASFMDGLLRSTISGIFFYNFVYKLGKELYWAQNQLNRFSFKLCDGNLIITEGLFLNSRNISHDGG